MKRRLLVLLALITFLGSTAYAQSEASWLYKGKVGTAQVTMYIKEYVGCGNKNTYLGMYRYDNKSKWLLLYIENKAMTNWCLTEADFTGVLLLDKSANKMDGIWMSPDHKKQLDVKLQIQYPAKDERAELTEQLDRILSDNSDC